MKTLAKPTGTGNPCLAELTDLISRVMGIAWTLDCVGMRIKDIDMVETLDPAESVGLLSGNLSEAAVEMSNIVSRLTEQPEGSPADDPVFAVVERMKAAQDRAHAAGDDEQAHDRASDALSLVEEELVKTIPVTPEGVRAKAEALTPLVVQLNDGPALTSFEEVSACFGSLDPVTIAAAFVRDALGRAGQ